MKDLYPWKEEDEDYLGLVPHENIKSHAQKLKVTTQQQKNIQPNVEAS